MAASCNSSGERRTKAPQLLTQMFVKSSGGSGNGAVCRHSHGMIRTENGCRIVYALYDNDFNQQENECTMQAKETSKKFWNDGSDLGLCECILHLLLSGRLNILHISQVDILVRISYRDQTYMASKNVFQPSIKQ